MSRFEFEGTWFAREHEEREQERRTAFDASFAGSLAARDLPRWREPDYGCSLPESLIGDTYKRVYDEAMRSVEAAVKQWAAQVGMTVEQWCELYEAHLEIVPPGEDFWLTNGYTFSFKVMVHLRGTGQVVLPPSRSEP